MQLNNKWYDFQYEALYFYNVYGNRQIEKGRMATVIGIFENQLKNKKKLTVVKPGSQSRKFTHINDTVKGCFIAWKKIRIGIILSQTPSRIQYFRLLICFQKHKIYQK